MYLLLDYMFLVLQFHLLDGHVNMSTCMIWQISASCSILIWVLNMQKLNKFAICLMFQTVPCSPALTVPPIIWQTCSKDFSLIQNYYLRPLNLVAKNPSSSILYLGLKGPIICQQFDFLKHSFDLHLWDQRCSFLLSYLWCSISNFSTPRVHLSYQDLR